MHGDARFCVRAINWARYVSEVGMGNENFKLANGLDVSSRLNPQMRPLMTQHCEKGIHVERLLFWAKLHDKKGLRIEDTLL
jgi:hypothetical protein